MNYILFDDETRLSLLPFTFTRPVAEIRMGILTIREKWEKQLGKQVSFFTESFLQEKFPLKTEADNILINGAVLPDELLTKEINALKAGEKISGNGFLIAWRISGDELNSISSLHKPDISNAKAYPAAIKISFCWDIFSIEDYNLLT